MSAGSPMPPSMSLGPEAGSNAAAAAASAASAAAHAAAAAVMNQPVASVQASTETMEQVSRMAQAIEFSHLIMTTCIVPYPFQQHMLLCY